MERREEQHETYQTAAGLRVTAAGVTVAVAPLTGAQVKARARPRVTFIALLQGQEKHLRWETCDNKEEYVFVPLQQENRQDCNYHQSQRHGKELERS